MNTDRDGFLLHPELTDQVIGAFYEVYNELGPGFLEGVYENALILALRARDITAIQQEAVAVHFRDTVVGEFRVDLMIENVLIVEIKAASVLTAAHEAQLLNYLKATRYPLGLLLNFGPRAQFRRRIFTPDQIRVHPRPSVAKTCLTSS